jgi:hypothetical protein
MYNTSKVKSTTFTTFVETKVANFRKFLIPLSVIFAKIEEFP